MAISFPYPSENMSNVLDLFSYANTLTEGFLGIGILITIAAVSFLATKSNSTVKALSFSGFLSVLVAILLRFMGLINDMVLYLAILAFVGIMVWSHTVKEQETP